MNDAEKFKEANPHYTDEQLRILQSYVEENGIPFCDFCKDYKLPHHREH